MPPLFVRDSRFVSARATAAPHPFPRLRWVAFAWMWVYVPSYAYAYGWLNFLFLCNLGVFLTAAALWTGNRLVLSSQAIASPVIGLAWALDAGWRVATGAHLYGATEYMWDPRYPLFTRLLSLYHLAWPVITLWALRRVGYDRRGWALQAGIASVAIVVARAISPPSENINFAFRDPLLGRAFEPVMLHLVVVVASLTLVAYGATHAALLRTGFARGVRRG